MLVVISVTCKKCLT